MPEHLGHLNLTERETAILSDGSRGLSLVDGRVAHDARADLYTEIRSYTLHWNRATYLRVKAFGHCAQAYGFSLVSG